MAQGTFTCLQTPGILEGSYNNDMVETWCMCEVCTTLGLAMDLPAALRQTLSQSNQAPNLFQENFVKQEQNFERHYNDVMQTLEQKYEENMQALGEEKKEKLEALYEQLVSCGENLDTCKDLMETIDVLGRGDNSVDVVKVRITPTSLPQMGLPAAGTFGGPTGHPPACVGAWRRMSPTPMGTLTCCMHVLCTRR